MKRHHEMTGMIVAASLVGLAAVVGTLAWLGAGRAAMAVGVAALPLLVVAVGVVRQWYLSWGSDELSYWQDAMYPSEGGALADN